MSIAKSTAAALALLAASATSAAEVPIKPLLAQYSAAWSKGDAAALAGLFTGDGQAVTSGMAVDGREAIQALYAAAFAGGPSTMTTRVERVRAIGPNAAVGRGWARIASQSSQPACLRFLTTLERTGAGWRISALADSPIPCPAGQG